MSRTARQGGFALLTVLWTLGFLALLGTALLATARQNTQRVTNLLDGAAAEAAADGAVHQAIFAVLDTSDQRWLADGSVRTLRFGAHAIDLRVDDESGKVNPNIAPAELLAALMVQLRVPSRLAEGLAARIVDWRSLGLNATQLSAQAQAYAAAGRDHAPAQVLFDNLDDLGAVLGMTTELLARLRPHLTLYTDTDPDASSSDPVVAAALGVPGRRTEKRGPAPASQVVAITVAVRGPRLTAYGARVVVRTNMRSDIRRFEILSRETVPTTR